MQTYHELMFKCVLIFEENLVHLKLQIVAILTSKTQDYITSFNFIVYSLSSL